VSKTEYCARLEECCVICSGLDPFGALTAGFARITGPVTLVTDVQNGDEVAMGQDPRCMIRLGNGTLALATVRFDFVLSVSCSALMITPSLGVCIEKVKQTTNTYVRIGIVTAWDSPVHGLTVSDHVPSRSIILI
jgi:hypothetical protein